MKTPVIARAAHAVVIAIVAGTALLHAAEPCRAQGTPADYARAEALRDRTRDKVFRTRVEPHWTAGSSRFWYRNDLPGGDREFIAVDPERRTRVPAFDHERLARALGRKLGRSLKPTCLPLERIALGDEGAVVFELDGKTWRFDPNDDAIEPAEPIAAGPRSEPAAPRREGRRGRSGQNRGTSPDGRWVAFTKDHNLYLRDARTGDECALSREGTADDGYEGGFFWSPDSTRLAALRTRQGDERKVYLIESSPSDQLQPKLHSHDYLKPGDKVDVRKPHLFDVAARKEIALEDALYRDPWSLTDFHWSPDSSRFTFLYNERGHQVLRLVAIDAATGGARAVIDERSPTFVDYSQKMFLQYLDPTDEVLWMSERDGWNHLYLFDARTGQLKNQVTRGPWVVRGIDRVDADARQVWFHAGGIHPGQDPYYVHYARINFDGGGLVVLTEGDGTHRVAFSPDRRYVLDTYSRVDLPPVTELRSAADGSLVVALERADWSALIDAGWRAPERFHAPGRDGATAIYGVIFRPSNHDPKRRYPVIEQIYAGPQGAFVPKAFAPSYRAQELAELGFIVVQVDGMGTNWRSKAFHDVCWKNLGDAGLPDRIAWMRAAAAKDPSMDLARVGVYGGSAGGQNALGALLFHPEFYKVGVADCGCHDNRMDKIWWNEAWMGWPIGPHYAEQSNVTNAHKLRGKLLLFVGELDRNVDPASTMQVVRALIKAGKDFDFVVFPGAGHGAGGSPYGERRKRDFFVRHLLGVEPPPRNGDAPASSPVATAERPQVDRAVARTALALKPSSDVPPLDELAPVGKGAPLRAIIERHESDRRSLRGLFPQGPSPGRVERFRQFHREWLEGLNSLDFDALDHAGKVDYLLFRNHLEHELRDLELEQKKSDEIVPLLPFMKAIAALEESRRHMDWAEPAKTADLLNRLNDQVKDARKELEAKLKAGRKAGEKDEGDQAGDQDKKNEGPIPRAVANRAARSCQGLRNTLRHWYGFYDGYHPVFTWWVSEPYKVLDKSLQDYAAFLREKVAGLKPGDEETIVGDPIGREALLAELAHEMVPYTPEELMAIAEKEFAWCEAEMKRAARDMGCGDDWKQAIERVKAKHVEPGKQPELIRDLALEAIKFLDDRQLVTIPPLARESWRMEMMTPKRQLVNPFFTGGEVISVSYPTSGMTHEQKLMSMRGNNVHFARATVQHELIPGHHLQLFMADRYQTHRATFQTPFLVEGWALYWELLLWDLKFPQSPEDRVGMLFWRMHRCARILFSLGFHLGKMTPEECINLLVDRVGHERDNASAEVRRSFGGEYSPLYQCAYMLGGLQLRALRRELVDSGKMTDRAFHDAILHENAIPIEMIRASLMNQELTRDFKSTWRFSEAGREER